MFASSWRLDRPLDPHPCTASTRWPWWHKPRRGSRYVYKIGRVWSGVSGGVHPKLNPNADLAPSVTLTPQPTPGRYSLCCQRRLACTIPSCRSAAQPPYPAPNPTLPLPLPYPLLFLCFRWLACTTSLGRSAAQPPYPAPNPTLTPTLPLPYPLLSLCRWLAGTTPLGRSAAEPPYPAPNPTLTLTPTIPYPLLSLFRWLACTTI